MKSVAAVGLGILLLILGGCGSGAAPTPGSEAPTTAAEVQDRSAFPTPDFSQPSRLFLVADTNSQLTVGDPPDAFKAAFPRSISEARTLDHQLPIGAEPPRWDARGWAHDNAARGVGALFYDNRLALAMSQFDGVEETDVQKELKKYEDLYGEPTKIPGDRVRYWFWQRGSVVLMICAFKNDKNELDLTTGLGDAGVMSRLNMSPSTALEEQKTVERLYSPIGGSARVLSETN